MTMKIPRITPFLWFDTQAEEAAKLYTSIFPNSKIEETVLQGEAGPGPKGSVMTVAFELDGQQFTALNGGPAFKFNEAISFVVNCQNQEELDNYWEKLSEGGEEGQCGWLKDKYGVSWQIVPAVLHQLLQGADQAKQDRVMQAILPMKKLDIAELVRAAEQQDRGAALPAAKARDNNGDRAHAKQGKAARLRH
jgi:predicted 3-demethylubiquinone-9 3-methyltransferase (glyoxalase superfamily)